MAQGKYFLFLDHDDYLTLDCVERLYAAAIATQAPLTFCNIRSVKAPGAKAPCDPLGLYIPKGWIKRAQLVVEGAAAQSEPALTLEQVLSSDYATIAKLEEILGQAVPSEQSVTSEQAVSPALAMLDPERENGSVYDLQREKLLSFAAFVFMPINPSVKLFDTALYRECDLRFEEAFSAEDQDWSLRVCCEFPHYALACFPGLIHMVRDVSLGHANSADTIEGRCRCMQLRYECLCKYGLIERFKFEHLLVCLGLEYSYRNSLGPKLSKEFRQKVYELLSKQGYSL